MSLKRAAAVANLLRLRGVAETKITVIGLGESWPIATNETESGRALNRRVEFFLSSVAEAIGPSIRGSQFEQSYRNNHDPGCHAGSTAAGCGKTTITQFPTNTLTPSGKLRPTGEIINMDGNASFKVQEIPEREHIPTEIERRPHIE